MIKATTWNTRGIWSLFINPVSVVNSSTSVNTGTYFSLTHPPLASIAALPVALYIYRSLKNNGTTVQKDPNPQSNFAPAILGLGQSLVSSNICRWLTT